LIFLSTIYSEDLVYEKSLHKFFWLTDGSLHTAGRLFQTAETTQVFATFFPVYGIFMEPIGLALAGFVWIYAFVFFVINDFVEYGSTGYWTMREAGFAG
jgi:hypothetical protein